MNSNAGHWITTSDALQSEWLANVEVNLALIGTVNTRRASRSGRLRRLYSDEELLFDEALRRVKRSRVCARHIRVGVVKDDVISLLRHSVWEI